MQGNTYVCMFMRMYVCVDVCMYACRQDMDGQLRDMLYACMHVVHMYVMYVCMYNMYVMYACMYVCSTYVCNVCMHV
jgi:hypothetical protein